MTKKPEEIVKMSKALQQSRLGFTEKIGKALIETRKFSADVSLAIGEISIEEAEEAVISYFSEQIRKGATVIT
jgi:hypothetical protein